MEEREYLISLYEYYGNLLTTKQQQYFIDYYYENLTMEEIAYNNKVSKNSVSKQLISIKEKLNYYEKILKLNFNNNKIMSILKEEDISKIIDYI